MKKGYLCPKCGNNEAAKLEVVSSGRTLLPVLLAPQKILRSPDVKISCMDCGCSEAPDIFRSKRALELL